MRAPSDSIKKSSPSDFRSASGRCPSPAVGLRRCGRGASSGSFKRGCRHQSRQQRRGHLQWTWRSGWPDDQQNFIHPSGIVPEGMSSQCRFPMLRHLLANIPGFRLYDDREKGGRLPRRWWSSKGLAQEVVRTTVLIETIRNTDTPSMPPAPVQAAGASPKASPPAVPLAARYSRVRCRDPYAECAGCEGDRASE